MESKRILTALKVCALAALVATALVGSRLGPVSATGVADVSGKWVVTSIAPDDCQLTFVQNGTKLTITGTCIGIGSVTLQGTINIGATSGTGSATSCTILTVSGTFAPDGNSVTGTSNCDGFPAGFSGTRQPPVPPPVIPCPVKPDQTFPAAGCDNFGSRWAVGVNFTNPPIGDLTCSGNGPTQVTRSSVGDKQPNGLDEIGTEIVTMELTGRCEPGSLPFRVRESPTLASSGQVEEQVNGNPGTLEFPADSFFDVFFEVDTPIGTLHNNDPLTMECKVSDIPPIGCLYIPVVADISVFDTTDKLVGVLKHGSHSPEKVDTDFDGCSDQREQGLDPIQGGQRNPLDFWDFYDTPDADGVRDQVVDLFNDIFAVSFRFGALGDPNANPLTGPIPAAPGYHTAFDRTSPPPSGDPWDTQAADGAIDLFNDIFGVAFQFGHGCPKP